MSCTQYQKPFELWLRLFVQGALSLSAFRDRRSNPGKWIKNHDGHDDDITGSFNDKSVH